MVVVQVQPNGQAPAGLSAGDFVNTNGGLYQVVAPGTYGSTYNPASGYWSMKYDPDAPLNSPSGILAMTNSAQSQALANTQMSQNFAREQMQFQSDQVKQLMNYNTSSAREAMQFNADQAEINRNFQERLSNTAHQREVRDLIAAGLNPILSAGGSGATTPSGATASGVNATGAAASGASGNVDTSGVAAMSSLLGQLISSSTSIDIAKIQAAASMYSADRGFAGTQYSADTSYKGTALNARNQQYLLYKQQQFDDYMAKEYPSADKAIVRAVNDVTGFLTRVFTGKNTSGRDYADIVEAWYDLGADLASKYGSKGVGVKSNILNAVLSGEKGVFGDKYWDRYYENKAKKSGASYK